MTTLPGAEDFPAELAARLAATLADEPTTRVRSRHRDPDGRPRYANRLLLESSPYLRQHAHNPVNWYSWGDEAFAAARRLGRPVFLSIGYSTCHWCHVMEEESFEDEAIAALLNATHVAIKVDREERPDVDAIYMRSAQALTGSGGWPLSVWLTPERQPFYAGTYFPPRTGVRGAAAGFIDLLRSIARLYRDDLEHVGQAARSLTDVIRATAPAADEAGGSFATEAGLAWIARVVDQCRAGFDERYGGMRAQQKFPSHLPLRLLLRHHARTGDAQVLDMAVRTLQAMASGGIYDQLAGGFHRYATDPAWRIPHFEKMLYDNAQLVLAYTEAWQVTKRPSFARVVRETCDELLATFAAPEGGFFSATDADSEGVEGKYFVWTAAEIRLVLGPGPETEQFLQHYGVADGAEHVLAERKPDEESVSTVATARARLAQVRRHRVPPLRDEKILAAWNGLALSAFAVAGRVFAEPNYVAAARRTADFLLTRMRDGESGRLVRSYCAGSLGVRGFLDDHACAAAGLLDLFETTGEARWLYEAIRLCEIVERDFGDLEHGGWFMVGPACEDLLVRERSVFDGAEPAGASVALMNAARLAVYTDDPRWSRAAEQGITFLRPILDQQPMAATEALLAVDFLAGPVREIVIALPEGGTGEPLFRALRERFCPRKVLAAGQPSSAEWQTLAATVPLLRDKVADGRATAYVCAHGRCDLPTTDSDRFAEQLSG